MLLFSSIGPRTFVVLASMLVCTAAWSDASAQSSPDSDSGIVGTVVSSETGDPVPFATIRYFPVDAPAGAAGEASSLGDGTFRISAAPGTYRLECSHPSYATAERTDVEVREGSYATYDLALSAAAAGVESFEIKARRLDNSPAALLSKQQRAPAVSDGISADQIRRSTDSNAAEALARVTGMSVVSGGYVFVRGLGERYSQSTINGNPVGSPDPNKRVLPMDLFPASLLDNVVIQKTYTPDQPGDFSGGVVDVRTVTFPTYRRWSFSVAGGRRGTTTGRSFSTYEGGKHDYWGFSDSFREVPGTVTALAGDTKVTAQDVFGGGFSPAELTEMGRSFNKVWSPTTETAAPAHDYSASYGDELALFGRPLGFVGSFSLTHGFEQTDFEDVFYNNAAGTDTLDKATDFAGAESKASTLWGAVVSSGYRLADAHKLTLDVLYTRNAEDQVRQYEGDASLDRLARVKRLKYQESGVFVGSAGMNHVFPFLGSAQLDWHVNYSEMENNEPDRREYLYELFDMVDPDTGEPFQQWQLTRRSDSLGLTRLYFGMKDYERGGRGDLTVPFRQWNGLESKVKVGALVRNKDRGADLRRFAFRRPTTGTMDFSLSPEELLVDANIGGGNDPSKFYLFELTRSNDGYGGKHDIQAAYGMVDLPLARKLRLVTGLRVEDSRLHVITVDRFNPSAPPISEGNLDETNLLPSVNATYAMTEEVNFRAAYSRTLARPDIRELSDLEMPGFVGGPTITGNPDLEQSDIKNYDLRAEWY
ncbi:MAG: TonB-dependent receptor domain-containing protein, partial [bacterium]